MHKSILSNTLSKGLKKKYRVHRTINLSGIYFTRLFFEIIINILMKFLESENIFALGSSRGLIV